MNVRSHIGRSLALAVALQLLLGCAGQQAFQRGEQLLGEEQYDAAVSKFAEAVTIDPESNKYRAQLAVSRQRGAWAHLEAGRKALAQDRLEQAVGEFRVAVDMDPTLETARQELQQVEGRLRAQQLLAEAEGFAGQQRFLQAKRNIEEALLLTPGDPRALALREKVREGRRTVVDGYELDVASDKPITLRFKNARLKEVFALLSKLSGINFIFDEDLKDQNTSVLLEQATFAQALELLLKMNGLGKRVLNTKTIIIYTSSKDKDKQYQDHVIQTFYLSNIEAKKAVNLLRTVLQLRKIYVHEELNALVIRDSPDVIKLAQQMLEAADRADSEVVFDLEVVAVQKTDDLQFGPTLSTYSTRFGFVPPGTTVIPDTVTVVDGLSSLDFLYTIPTATFNFKKTLKDSEILANPKIRVKNKEKAKVLIGTREPVITVTTNAGLSGSTSENIQYIDVGVKLDVEPVVQLDNTVVTKLGLEVSSVSGRQTTPAGSVALTITTTTASTALTLKDGEQTIIGGLIRDDSSNSKDTIPWLHQIPLLGDLISGTTKNSTKTEILLSVTPHIVKGVDLPRPDVASIWSGSEDDLKAGPNFSAFAETFEPRLDQPLPMPVPARTLPPDPRPAGPTSANEKAGPEARTPGTVAPPDRPLQPGAPRGAEVGPASDLEPVTITPPVPGPGEADPGLAAEPAETGIPEGSALPEARAVAEEAVSSPEMDAAAAVTTVFLRGPQLVGTGEEFLLEVAVDGAQGLSSAPLILFFSADRLEFVRAEEGDLLGQGGAKTVFTANADQKSGRVILGAKQVTVGAGATGGGSLARLVFRGKSPGPATVNPDRFNFQDPAGNRLPASGASFALEVR